MRHELDLDDEAILYAELEGDTAHYWNPETAETTVSVPVSPELGRLIDGIKELAPEGTERADVVAEMLAVFVSLMRYTPTAWERETVDSETPGITSPAETARYALTCMALHLTDVAEQVADEHPDYAEFLEAQMKGIKVQLKQLYRIGWVSGLAEAVLRFQRADRRIKRRRRTAPDDLSGLIDGS